MMFAVTKTDLRTKSSEIERALLEGQRMVVMSHGQAIGMLVPEIDDDIKAILKVKRSMYPFKRVGE
jgi:antitoxin (DNA-binding transcriptional repressor) of toxin-antitoxin stability system